MTLTATPIFRCLYDVTLDVPGLGEVRHTVRSNDLADAEERALRAHTGARIIRAQRVR